ncbi:MAG TPA: hypothetical protein VHC43_01465 [Mycobacteriales bacterium]|nr:hypothetical protein [Mycobacteriales bacterium]
MEHVVFYQSAQGAPAFRRVASLEDAVSFAEHLRNVEGVADFSVYSLAPVTLSTRAYYHVEVAGAPVTDATPTDATATDPFAASPAPAAPDAQPAPLPTSPPPLPEPATVGLDALPAAPVVAPPYGAPVETGSAVPAMSFNALEEEATTPSYEMPAPVASVPFAAAPLPPPPAGLASISETFVKDDPADLPPPADASPGSAADAPVDPSVVDPTVEEVAPASPPGRRSMGFFARS